ncbi:tlde1 domain-containing protein [Novosphingobium sp. SL115]|uniref:tlde1 domain-containing protein n=1 Tax=Novosphingobium sp. SL115 TaxID=2995150 RepID=UPI003FA3918F
MFAKTDTFHLQSAVSKLTSPRAISPKSEPILDGIGFRYEQTSGRLLWRRGDSFRFVATGYAGAPGFVNDPDADHLRQRGPIPRGQYWIRERKHSRFQSPAFFLDPFEENEMHGRSGFWIHGDNARLNRSGSTGCIVIGWHDRAWIGRQISGNHVSPVLIVTR